MTISKIEILQMSNYGYDFYKFVIPTLQTQGNKCKNTVNPFYDDTKPSLSIFFKDGQWLFNDYGNPDYKGDVFTFAAHYYGLNARPDFNTILNKMAADLRISVTHPVSIKTQYSKIEKQLYALKKNPKKVAAEYMRYRCINDEEGFFQSNAYKDQPPAVVFQNHNSTGFEKKFIEGFSAYDYSNFPKTMFTGTKANTVYDYTYKPKSDTVCICEGVINALSFAESSYSSIATFGVGNIPSPELLEKYIKNKTVYLAGDGDEAGQKFNKDISDLIKEHNIPVKEIYFVEFPEGKDANDLLCENGSINLEIESNE